MANIALILRDTTAGQDVVTDSLLNPADASGGEAAARQAALTTRIGMLRLQAEMNVTGVGEPARANHAHIVTRDGATIYTAPIPAAWVSKTVVLHASGGSTVDSVVCSTRDLYAATMVRFKLAIEGNPGLNYYITES